MLAALLLPEPSYNGHSEAYGEWPLAQCRWLEHLSARKFSRALTARRG
jgi:hypothetical protein